MPSPKGYQLAWSCPTAAWRILLGFPRWSRRKSCLGAPLGGSWSWSWVGVSGRAIEVKQGTQEDLRNGSKETWRNLPNNYRWVFGSRLALWKLAAKALVVGFGCRVWPQLLKSGSVVEWGQRSWQLWPRRLFEVGKQRDSGSLEGLGDHLWREMQGFHTVFASSTWWKGKR